MSTGINFTYLAAAIASLLLVLGGPAKAPPQGNSDYLRGSQPVFGLAGDPTLTGKSRGDRSQYGRYDTDGNFIPEAQLGSFRNNTVHGILPAPNNRFTRMGEHRSGRLIHGTMVNDVFVPEIGSKVLDIKTEFDVNKPDRIVYNLFEALPAFWTEERKKRYPKGLPNDPEPPQAGVPVGWKLISFREANSEKQDRWHVRVIGTIAEFGYLDGRGEFIPEYNLPAVARSGLLGSIWNDPSVHFPAKYYTLPANRARFEEVYEFRSGRLIEGTLHDTGNFVPKLGSTVIDFKDYNPLGLRRIYNLPGVLQKIPK